MIETGPDVDTYRVRSDQFAPGTPTTLNVMVWGLDANPLDARVRVYDAGGNPVAFQVLSNDRGLFSVQVLGAVAGQNYFVQVFAREGGAKSTGTYFFAADFNRLDPLVFDNVASGAVGPNATTGSETLALTEAGLFQFALGAQSARAGDAVTMTVYDASGTAVFSLTAVAGRAPVTASKYLTAGTYTVRYTGARANAFATSYDLFILQLSEGVGPYATSTASPSSSTAPGSGSFSDPSSVTLSPPPPPSSPGALAPEPTPAPTYTYYGSSTYQPRAYFYTF